MNLYYLILIRIIIVGFHLWWLLKYTNLRSHDKTMSFRFDGISWVRIGLMTLLNLSLFVIPATKMPLIYGIVVGNGMIALTALQLRQIMILGDRYLFYKESGFLVRDIEKFEFDGKRVHMRIKGHPISFSRPITNLEYCIERLSGRRPRRRFK